ncbi:helix-turn-helix transcriptional regulator [Jeotgalibacillus terrae]|uniref:Helix-turn-helix transcriptional regulator n=1 Tax=Jeotgalibacillus terrae TaxID=587735 RepID=A0ABW5ZGB0_9BACL|nr:helix-turn-helix transcriptional regulator [Jeotgalibacillus terrae]MBM7580063.1 DNA-binding XRE family transcriptional regulator [Jeotgalibacillus terrae]
MLVNLKAEMARKGIPPKKIAKFLGVKTQTVNDKLSGKYKFSFEHALAIRDEFFPDKKLEYLFKKNKEEFRARQNA